MAENVLDHGAVPGGVTDCASAFNAAAAAATPINGGSGVVVVPGGTYLIGDPIEPQFGVEWVGAGATLLAGRGDLTIFHVIDFAYYTRFSGFRFSGNGHSNVTALDFRNWRLSAAVDDCIFDDLTFGLVAHDACFGATMTNCTAWRTPYPVHLPQNASGFTIINPSFDNSAELYDPNKVYASSPGTGAGVWITDNNATIANHGVKIIGGYIQGFDVGVRDGGMSTFVSCYFEFNTSADIYALNARSSQYQQCTHVGLSGPTCVAYDLDGCHTVTIDNPHMSSGARLALYRVSNCVDCIEYRPKQDSSVNEPLGDVDKLGKVLPTDGSFDTIILGGTTGGANTATYTAKTSRWQRVGDQVTVNLQAAWSGHAGSGAIIVQMPPELAPAAFDIARIGQVAVSGIETNGALHAQFRGNFAELSIVETDSAGNQSLLQLTSAGSLTISISYLI